MPSELYQHLKVTAEVGLLLLAQRREGVEKDGVSRTCTYLGSGEGNKGCIEHIVNDQPISQYLLLL